MSGHHKSGQHKPASLTILLLADVELAVDCLDDSDPVSPLFMYEVSACIPSFTLAHLFFFFLLHGKFKLFCPLVLRSDKTMP